MIHTELLNKLWKLLGKLKRIPFKGSELFIRIELELLEFANGFTVDEETGEIKKSEMYEGYTLKYCGQSS